MDIFGEAKKFFDDVGSSIASGYDEITGSVRNMADDARKEISRAYSEATDWIQDQALSVTPEVLAPAVAGIMGGTAMIGKHVLDFVDPVGYALDTAADTLETFKDPLRNVRAVGRMIDGDIEGGAKELGMSYLDSILLNGQIATMVIPAGHLAGKAAKKPIKAARKELKGQLKTSVTQQERKAIKHDLHTNRVRGAIVQPAAMVGGKMSENVVQDLLTEGRQHTASSRTRLRLAQRDWSKLGLEAPSNALPMKKRKRNRGERK